MIFKDLLELMDDDEEITVSINIKDTEANKGKPANITGPVWAMPWRFIKREVQSIKTYYDKFLIVVEDK